MSIIKTEKITLLEEKIRRYAQLMRKAEKEIFECKLKEISKIHNLRKDTMKITIKYNEDYFQYEESEETDGIKEFTSQIKILQYLQTKFNDTMVIHFHKIDNFTNMIEKTPRFIIVSTNTIIDQKTIKNETHEYSI